MRWRRIAFWVTFTTLALVVLVLSWLWTADLGVLKPQVERFVMEETGREFAIDGDFSVDLARHTTVIARDVRFGNAEWAESENMVTVGRIEVRVDLWSLLSGPVVVELIDLDDTEILLINPGDTDPNWKLPIDAGPDEDDAGEEPGLGVLFTQIDVDRLQVHLDSVERDRALHLVIDSLDQAHREDDYLDLELRGSLDGRRVEIDGEFGTWEALLAGKDFAADVDAVLDTFTLSARGRVDDVANLRRPDFEFTAYGPDIDDLTRMLGLGEEGEGDIKLSGRLAPVESGPLLLKVEGNLGLTEIDALGEVADLQSLEKLRLQVTASGPDLGRVLQLAGIHQVRESPFMLKFDGEMEDGRFDVREATMVFAEAHVEGKAQFPHFPSIDDAVISLQIEGPDIERFRYITGMPGAASGPFSLGFTIDVREDGVEVLELVTKTSLGELQANGSIGDPDTLLGTEFNVRVRTESLAMLAGAYGVEEMPDKPAEITGAAQYTKAGIRTKGPVSVVIDGDSAEVEGLIALRSGIEGTDVTVKAAGGDLAALVAMFAEATGVPALPYEVNGRLHVRDEGFRFTAIRGSLGTASVSGEGLLVPAEMIAGSWFDVVASGPDLAEALESASDLQIRPGPFELQGKVVFRGDLMELSKVRLDRESGDLRLDLTIGIDTPQQYLDFDVAANGRDVRSVLRGTGSFEAFEQPFSITARGMLRGPHWTFDKLDAAIGEATVTAAGDLEFVDAKATTQFDFALNIPSLASLGTIDGRRFQDQAFSVSANVTGGNGLLTAEKIDIRIGASDINGKVLVGKGDIPEIDIDVYSDRLVFRPLLEDAEPVAEPEFEDDRLIPNVAMPVEALRKLNGSIDIDIGELQRQALFLRDIELDARLRDGRLDVSMARFKARSGELLSRAWYDASAEIGSASLDVIARDFAFGMTEANVDLLMKGDLDIGLRTTGNDLRSMAGNANGVVYIDTRGGRVESNEQIRAIYGDMLEETLNTINPFRETDEYTEFECIIVPLSIDDGMITGAPSMLASTDKIRFVVQGSVDLKSEKIRIGVRSTPRRIVSFSAAELVNPYLQVVGTLSSPRLAVDEAGVLITGGAAVATGGLSLLAKGLWDRLSKSGDACKQMSGQALKELEGRLPTLVIGDPAAQE
jgi:uncharacterized protein involved in outer membrane biogenesis